MGLWGLVKVLNLSYFWSGTRRRWHPLMAMSSVCMLLNTGAVCGQIFMRRWKGRFFRASWTAFSWVSVISGGRDGEAAARSLQRRIGGTRCQCALNTSCVDHGALMSTLWDLSSWRYSLQTNFCLSYTFCHTVSRLALFGRWKVVSFFSESTLILL